MAFDPLPADDPVISRMRVTRTYTGDLAGTGTGQVLSVATAIEGSAAYLCLERVDAVLHGRRGTFLLQHCGRTDRGRRSLTVTVVPDSGTEDLLGLRGELSLEDLGARHRYTFDFSLRTG